MDSNEASCTDALTQNPKAIFGVLANESNVFLSRRHQYIAVLLSHCDKRRIVFLILAAKCTQTRTHAHTKIYSDAGCAVRIAGGVSQSGMDERRVHALARALRLRASANYLRVPHVRSSRDQCLRPST